ncbi:MAG: type II toxin-antitoxin system PemK/MazF family toxin [Alphaproteobacteria bacterium]
MPDRGDLVWLTFATGAGHEQAGRRPALVLTPAAYNRRAGLAAVCPVTSRVKGYPFEVALPDRLQIRGVILADQLRSVDWRKRQASFAERTPAAVIDEVSAKIRAPLAS